MYINVGVSNRHIHLSKADFEFLFSNSEFYSIKGLSQSGEFASNLTLCLKTDKNVIPNVRIVGPFRSETQVEISKTDAYFLGINPPIKLSGNVSEAGRVILKNKDKELEVNSCIIAKRHLHMNNIESEKLNLKNGDIVSVIVDNERGGVLDNIIVRVKENYNLELHLDTDEANAFNLKNNDKVLLGGKNE